MNACTKAVSGAYDDDKRETCNSLLRIKTPYPKREACDEISVKVVSCACAPLKLLEAAGMIACGAVLLPILCTPCKIDTEHQGTEISIKRIYPACKMPHIPCHYEDTYHADGKATTSKGMTIGCNLNQRPKGEINHTHATSSLGGYDCLSSGVGKVINTLFSMIFCPIDCVRLACCDN